MYSCNTPSNKCCNTSDIYSQDGYPVALLQVINVVITEVSVKIQCNSKVTEKLWKPYSETTLLIVFGLGGGGTHSRHPPAAMSWHCPNTLTPSPHKATHFMWMTVADTPLHTLSQHPHPKSTHFMLMTTTDTCCPNTHAQPHTSC